MAKYTIELRKVCEYYTRETVESWFKDYDINDYLTPEQIAIINKANIWSKDKLAKKIVDHYFMREIGFETPALFKLYAKITMQELMEEKLPFIYSSSIQYDPLVNVDFTETFDRTQNSNSNVDSKNTNTSKNSSTGNSSSTSLNSSSGLSVNSNTPQGQIIKQNVLDGKYASSVTANESNSDILDDTNSTTSGEASSNGTVNSTVEDNNTEHYSKTIKGNSGVSATAQKMIEQYRQNIFAIDKDIIKNLSGLFMGLY